ncbi:hypothetical protein Daesc_004546 [Daldinia eschscholtzii]|uniref:Protein alcS n=1 Tax=Daldinia eschscholtzii TaxID=292717 RepID=A0AAX6MPM4_9PEZI
MTTRVNTVLNHSDEEKGLHRSETTVTMPPELFEKLYLTPKVPQVGDYNKRFANPTPLGIVGGIFFFVGPVMLLFAMVFEWIMGNFFPMMAMGLYAVFWLSFGMLQLPTLQLGEPYATTGDPTGQMSPEYNSVIGIYLVVWGFALFTFFLFTLKVNAVFAVIFACATSAVWVLSSAYFRLAAGNYEAAASLQKAGGALLFVVATLGWYMCIVIMAGEMRITVNLPLGDLTRFWPRTDVDLAEAAVAHRD